MLGNTFSPDYNTEATLRGTYSGNWTAGSLEPGVFSGAFSSPFVGIKHALDVGASALAEAATPILEEVTPDAIGGWLKDQRRSAYQSMAETRPNPATMGIVGQVGHALGSVMTMGAMGAAAAPFTGLSSLGLAAYAIGGMTGYDKYHELREQGVDEASAMKAAAITGTTMGIGAALPPFMGGTIAKQIGSGIGINVGLGMGERAGTAAVLAEKYPEIAKHYQTLDSSAILVDAVLGAAFPIGARMLPKSREVTVGELDTAMSANQGVAAQTRDPALQTTLEGIDARLAADLEVTRQIMEEGRLPGEITVPPGAVDNVIPNPAVGREAALVARAIDDLMTQESGVSLRQAEAEIAALADAFKGANDAVQVRSAEEVDVRQQTRDGEAVGKRVTAEETAAARQAEEEVVIPTSQKVLELEQKYEEARAKLEAIGEEPRKPSSEKSYFGTRGRDGADSEVVAKYDADVKAYKSWRTKYSKLKKAEVDASNQLFYARKEAEVQRPKVGADDTPTVTAEQRTQLEKASVMYDDGRGERAMSAREAADHMTKQMNLYRDFIKCIGG